MRHAFSYMVVCKSSSQQRPLAASHWYEAAREMAAQKRDDQWKRRISDSLKGRKPSPESVEKMRKSLTGRKLSEIAKQNISAGAVGFSDAARRARLLTKQGTFEVTTPEGETFIVTNLKAWCLENGFNYHTAINNSKLPNPIKRGAMVGYAFKVLP